MRERESVENSAIGELLTGDPELARVARHTLDFVLCDLTSPAGQRKTGR